MNTMTYHHFLTVRSKFPRPIILNDVHEEWGMAPGKAGKLCVISLSPLKYNKIKELSGAGKSGEIHFSPPHTAGMGTGETGKNPLGFPRFPRPGCDGGFRHG